MGKFITMCRRAHLMATAIYFTLMVPHSFSPTSYINAVSHHAWHARVLMNPIWKSENEQAISNGSIWVSRLLPNPRSMCVNANSANGKQSTQSAPTVTCRIDDDRRVACTAHSDSEQAELCSLPPLLFSGGGAAGTKTTSAIQSHLHRTNQ